MSSRLFLLMVSAIVLLVVVLTQSIYIVDERQRAVLLRFGEIEQPDVAPGIHFKIPLINKVRLFDGRLLTLDSQPQEYLTAEKKALVVDSFVQWRIDSVDKFYKATSGSELRAARLLSSRVDTGLRNKFGERTLREVVSSDRDQMITELIGDINGISRNELGVTVVDIRIKKIELPATVSRSVFERMVTERSRLAKELRAEGKEEAEAIRARADKQKTIIEAGAFREAQITKGAGDAESSRVYANAYSQDEDFYNFYRSLQAYESTFANKNDLLILEPDSDFFRFLKSTQ